jgi:hypothetical protein
MIKPGKTVMDYINLQVRSFGRRTEEPTKLLLMAGRTFQATLFRNLELSEFRLLLFHVITRGS